MKLAQQRHFGEIKLFKMNKNAHHIKKYLVLTLKKKEKKKKKNDTFSTLVFFLACFLFSVFSYQDILLDE